MGRPNLLKQRVVEINGGLKVDFLGLERLGIFDKPKPFEPLPDARHFALPLLTLYMKEWGIAAAE